MKDHSKGKRQFIQLSRAWYGKTVLRGRGRDIIDEITIGFYHSDGGTTGEFSIRWTELGGQETPMLCAFDDSWDALWQFRDILEKMAELDGTAPTPEVICELLISQKVRDATAIESPFQNNDNKKCNRLYSKPDSQKDIYQSQYK